MLQYVYNFYACIEGTYIAAILHILYYMMIISCYDHQHHKGSESCCMIFKTDTKFQDMSPVKKKKKKEEVLLYV